MANSLEGASAQGPRRRARPQPVGRVCFGISAKWWRDEHFEHHAFTNTLVQGVGSSDPQMKEVLWASNKVLLKADESQSIVDKTRKASEDLGEMLFTMEEEACDLTLQSTATAGRRASVRSGDELRTANEEALKKAFEAFDRDGDGLLSEDELLQVLTRPTPQRKPMTLAAAARMFRELDQNGDGQIDYTEFVQNWSRVVAKRAAEAASKGSALAAEGRRISIAVPSYHSGGGRLFDA